MRNNGRHQHEIRPLKIERNFTGYAEGSVLISLGRTRVICNATVEDKVPPFLRNSGKGWVTAEYAMLPRATQERNMRESVRGKLGGRTQEIQRLIGRSLRGIVNLDLMGERTIWIDCDVIQADGGSRTAAITGGFIALTDAILKVFKRHPDLPLPIRDYLAAISIGIVNDEIFSDLDYHEDSNADVDMNIVMTGSGKLIEIQATAEKRPFSRAKLNEMLKIAYENISEIVKIQRKFFGKIESRFCR